MNKALKFVLAVVVALVIGIVGFGAGVAVDRMIVLPAGLPGVSDPAATPELVAREVHNIISTMALSPSDDASMAAGVARGMVESLDDSYAVYFDREHYAYFNEQTSGEFYGIGITISDKDGKPTLVTVLKGTPAEASKLRAGDVIVSIDGVTREKWDLDEVVKRVRGPEGTKVKLQISREGSDKLLDFTITRAKIDVPNTDQELVDGNIGYIRLYTFNQRSGNDLRDAIKALEKQGAKGYVLDLRDNPGGLLGSSVDVLSLFVKDGVAVTVDGRADDMDETYRVSGDTVTKAPLVVLVNENSASASEIVAGALQDYDRATLVGMTSFGKGSVQQIEELSFGGAVKLTIAHYLTPKGRVIDKKGVVPEVVVKMEPEKQIDKKTDTQYERAIAELKKLL